MSQYECERKFDSPLFAAGRIYLTPGAAELLRSSGLNPLELVAKHVRGDDGDLCDEDRDANRIAIRLGARVFSSYSIESSEGEAKVWVITEADRNSTTLLLPEEY